MWASHAPKLTRTWITENWGPLHMHMEQLPPQSPGLIPCDWYLWNKWKRKLPEATENTVARKTQVVQKWA